MPAPAVEMTSKWTLLSASAASAPDSKVRVGAPPPNSRPVASWPWSVSLRTCQCLGPIARSGRSRPATRSATVARHPAWRGRRGRTPDRSPRPSSRISCRPADSCRARARARPWRPARDLGPAATRRGRTRTRAAPGSRSRLRISSSACSIGAGFRASSASAWIRSAIERLQAWAVSVATSSASALYRSASPTSPSSRRSLARNAWKAPR